jgi:hypothetical protein
MHRFALIAGVVAALAFASPAFAAPPVLTSVSHVDRHPAATWTLPSGVTSQVAEVATSPATSTDGYFFSENVKAFDVLQETQTNWVYNYQLDPGLYYVHIGGLDEPCFFAGLCPVREFSQTLTLEIPAPPPPPPPVRCRLPNVIGLRLARAKARIRLAHCTVGSLRRVSLGRRFVGRVISQNPRPGVIRVRGFGIRLGVGRR